MRGMSARLVSCSISYRTNRPSGREIRWSGRMDLFSPKGTSASVTTSRPASRAAICTESMLKAWLISRSVFKAQARVPGWPLAFSRSAPLESSKYTCGGFPGEPAGRFSGWSSKRMIGGNPPPVPSSLFKQRLNLSRFIPNPAPICAVLATPLGRNNSRSFSQIWSGNAVSRSCWSLRISGSDVRIIQTLNTYTF